MNICDLSKRLKSNSARRMLLCFTFLLLVGVPAANIYSQPEPLPDGVVPPPLVFIGKDESKQLDLETKLKSRTKLSLELMEVRIARAEKLSETDNYPESLSELAHFEALMKDAFSFLNRNEARKGILRNFKRLEIGLRRFRPRLLVLRREYPFSHSYHVGKLIENVKITRTESMDKFFSDTVIEN